MLKAIYLMLIGARNLIIWDKQAPNDQETQSDQSRTG